MLNAESVVDKIASGRSIIKVKVFLSASTPIHTTKNNNISLERSTDLNKSWPTLVVIGVP